MSYYNGPQIITNGLLFYLDAANYKSYPGTGTDWKDLTGINNTGSLINGPAFDSSNGDSISFDGTNDYVECGNFADNLGEMTVSAWVYRGTYANNNFKHIVSKISSIATGSGWDFWFAQATLGFVTQDSNGNNYRDFYTSYSNYYNKWTQVTATLTGGVNGTIKIYINGVSQALTNISSGSAVTNISNSEPVKIGWETPEAYTDYFSGKVAATLIYNRALFASEILQNYDAVKTRFGL